MRRVLTSGGSWVAPRSEIVAAATAFKARAQRWAAAKGGPTRAELKKLRNEVEATFSRSRRTSALTDFEITHPTPSYESAAHAFACWAASALDLTEPPTIHFFEPRSPESERILGLAWGPGSEIYVRVGLDPEQLAYVVFHEFRHIGQAPGMDRVSAERDADAFAREQLEAWRARHSV